MSNILVVESKNDKIFIDAVVNHLNCNNSGLNIEICIDEYETLAGLSEKELINKLKSIQARSQKIILEKLGIILDIDDCQQEDRIQFVNNCIQTAFEVSHPISKTGELIQVTTNYGATIQLACYFTNVDGQGELETVLKAIKTKDSPHADCLDNWKSCIELKKETITKKDFDKFWISNYLRFDTCSKEEKKQAGKYCSMAAFDYVMANKKEIWNFDDPILDDLKYFLRLFC